MYTHTIMYGIRSTTKLKEIGKIYIRKCMQATRLLDRSGKTLVRHAFKNFNTFYRFFISFVHMFFVGIRTPLSNNIFRVLNKKLYVESKRVEKLALVACLKRRDDFMIAMPSKGRKLFCKL